MLRNTKCYSSRLYSLDKKSTSQFINNENNQSQLLEFRVKALKMVNQNLREEVEEACKILDSNREKIKKNHLNVVNKLKLKVKKIKYFEI